jgi:hypothetical protein
MSDLDNNTGRIFSVATDDTLCALIRQARDKLVLIAPGITRPVALALGDRLTDTRLAVTVILDNDPEVYRLGFGTPEGLAALKEQLDANHLELRCQPGIRIGVLVADDKTLIFSPTPQLLEAGSTSPSKPNAVFLEGAVAKTLSEAAGASENTMPSNSEIGQRALTPKDVEAIKKNVMENPPAPFDLTQKARVFSSRLQYVEFTVEKYQLTRQTVPIPAYLMGLAGDMQDRWHNNLRVMDVQATTVKLNLIDAKGNMREVSVGQKYLDDERKKIEKKFLIPVVGFGSVMFKNKQKDFESATEGFCELLTQYFEKLEEQVSESLYEVVLSVVKRLLPSVKANPPEQYKRFGDPSDADLEEFLVQDISDAISVKTLLKEPKMKRVYKEVAYQSVQSDDFQKNLRGALKRAMVPASSIDDMFRVSTAVLEKGGSLHPISR